MTAMKKYLDKLHVNKDIDRIMKFQYSTLSLAELLDSGVMDGMNPQELLEDIVSEWYNLKAIHYAQNDEDRCGMIECIEGIEKSRMVDQE